MLIEFEMTRPPDDSITVFKPGSTCTNPWTSNTYWPYNIGQQVLIEFEMTRPPDDSITVFKSGSTCSNPWTSNTYWPYNIGQQVLIEFEMTRPLMTVLLSLNQVARVPIHGHLILIGLIT